MLYFIFYSIQNLYRAESSPLYFTGFTAYVYTVKPVKMEFRLQREKISECHWKESYIMLSKPEMRNISSLQPIAAPNEPSLERSDYIDVLNIMSYLF